MSVGLDHPEVARFLARLDTAAAGLPPGRREELGAEIREHLADALLRTGDDEVAVRQALDRLGSPEDIVADEWQAPAATGPVEGSPGQRDVPSAWPAPRPSPWGPLELAAVLLLTVGSVVLPLVGPLAGLVCAWVSARWTRRQKVVATVLTLLQLVVLVVLLTGTLVVSSSSGVSEDGVPAPVIESGPAVVP
jgi:uncharacterized membrane protein